MIVNYHRPKNLVEALDLLAKVSPTHVPLGGGTYLSHGYKRDCEVIDLQSLELNSVINIYNTLVIGATVTLTSLQENKLTPKIVQEALLKEKNRNIRNRSTVAGTLCTCSGRSIFGGLLLALDARLTTEPTSKEIYLSDFYMSRNNFKNLITSIHIPLDNTASFEVVSRTPSDFPIIYIAVGKIKDGQKRIVIGGSCEKPILVKDLLPNKDKPADFAQEIKHACSLLDNKWASQEYYKSISATLLERLI